MVAAMRDQRAFQCGEAIKGQEPRFFVGAAESPFASPVENSARTAAGQESQSRRKFHTDLAGV